MSLSFALLGFLNYSPLSGYDLKKILDDSINFFWAAQTSQIYRELKSLESEGYVNSKIHSSNKGPDKRIYNITEKGVNHLKNWLNVSHANEAIRNEFMVWILFSSHIELDDLYVEIKKQLKVYQKEYEMLKLVETKLHDYLQQFRKEGEDFYWKIVLNRGKLDVKAKIDWANNTLDLIKNKEAKG